MKLERDCHAVKLAQNSRFDSSLFIQARVMSTTAWPKTQITFKSLQVPHTMLSSL